MSDGADNDGTARKRKRRGGLRVPSDNVPRKTPTDPPPSSPDGGLAVAYAYSGEEGDPTQAEGDHDITDPQATQPTEHKTEMVSALPTDDPSEEDLPTLVSDPATAGSIEVQSSVPPDDAEESDAASASASTPDSVDAPIEEVEDLEALEDSVDDEAPAASSGSGDSVDIPFDDDDETAISEIPSMQDGAEAAAATADEKKPKFIRASTMALAESDLEEVEGMAAEARAVTEANRVTASDEKPPAPVPQATTPAESGEVIDEEMLEIVDGGNAVKGDGEGKEPAIDTRAATAPPVEDENGNGAGRASFKRADTAEPPPPPPSKPKAAATTQPIAPVAKPPKAPAAEPKAPEKARRRRGKPWFEEIFDEDYLRTLPFLTPKATQLEAGFVVESLGVDPGSQVLDVACGYGRHAMELAARGFHVVGLDNSLPLLLRGADEAQRRGLTINFVHGDMREMNFDSQFDGAYCLFSSFGFFDDETNKKTAQHIARALKPGARLVVEVLNRDYLIADLPSRVWWEGDGCVVLEEVEFNYFSSRIVSNRSVVFDDGRQLEQEISLRSFSLHELGKLLHAAGFRVLEISGGMATRGRFFGAYSRDIVVVAERRPPKGERSEASASADGAANGSTPVSGPDSSK